jgi:hypothetical protein
MQRRCRIGIIAGVSCNRRAYARREPSAEGKGDYRVMTAAECGHRKVKPGFESPCERKLSTSSINSSRRKPWTNISHRRLHGFNHWLWRNIFASG